MNTLLPSVVSIGVLGALMGGMNKMFGMNDEKTPQKLAEEMMAGAVRGILEHFEYRMDDLKRDVERKQEELTKLKDENDNLKSENQGFKDAIGKASAESTKAKPKKKVA